MEKFEIEGYAGEISFITHEDYIEFNSPIRIIPYNSYIEKDKFGKLLKALESKRIKVTIERVEDYNE